MENLSQTLTKAEVLELVKKNKAIYAEFNQNPYILECKKKFTIIKRKLKKFDLILVQNKNKVWSYYLDSKGKYCNMSMDAGKPQRHFRGYNNINKTSFYKKFDYNAFVKFLKK